MTIPSDKTERANYYDREYNARESVPDFSLYPQLYRKLSDDAHASTPCHRDVAYGPGSGDLLDIFPAAQAGSPVLLFIHGGYWRALSKADSAFMAPALTKSGACVVVLEYDLAPVVKLDHIVDQARRALAWIYHNIARYGADPERIFASGSSAGGHLSGMLLPQGWQAKYGVPANVLRGAMPISGLFDLLPLLETHVNDWMNLDEADATRNSPALNLPTSGTDTELVITCGDLETTEFKRQSQDFLDRWQSLDLTGKVVAAPGKNHYDIVLDLGIPGTLINRAILELMRLD
ncbi:alpha/beta hydrolase [Pseudomonas sp. TH03]|uniref:alpha/beta hydrolase n=1 Tax=Pseudomonas sp. TH03 TaxID=2796369 RepID=UPI00191314C3|nr:alpha/beta hydrolase [Pseudomonas sp. TH03]MBK5550672.1 alpha/beta hydrolase [Pseudomonas sp. TH03]